MLSLRFYQRFDSMLDATAGGLLRLNRGTDANRLNDLLTFMSNAILKSGKQIFWMRKPSKFNVPGWNDRAKELNAWYREAMSHWNNMVHLQSRNVGHELPSSMKWNFWERMINVVVSQCYQNFKGENPMISGKKLKHSILRRNPATNTGRNF